MASFAGGWFMIFQEIQRSDIRESVLLFAGAVIGVPGLAVGATSVADALARRRNGTDDSQPQQAESVES
jgi:hypothetical protein